MSQVLKDEMPYYTGNDEVQFSVSFDISTNPTYAPDAETQTVSLEIPDNEPLEDAEKDQHIKKLKNGIRQVCPLFGYSGDDGFC